MRLYLLILFFFATRFVSAQNRSIDSLQLLLQNHPTEDSVRVNILNELSNQYQWVDFFSSLRYAEDALRLASTIDFKRGIASANIRICHCYWALGDNELAIEKGLEAVEIAEQEKFETVLAESYQVLTRSYMDQRERAKAVDYNRKAEKIALQTKNWDLLSRVYNLSGVLQFINAREDSALLFYNKALSIIEEHHTSKLHLAQVTSNIGECYVKSNPDTAFSYFNKALIIARENKNRSAEAGTSSIIGNALLRKGKYKEADDYFKASLKLSRALGLKRVMRHAYAGLADLRAREGKATEALEYMRSYYRISDSLLNVTKTRQIVELETRHEIEKKEQEIKLLEQEGRIQKIWGYILLAGLALVAAFSLILFYLQRFRESKNREILNLQIDSLTSENKALTDKYKRALMIDDNHEKTMESVDERLLKKAIEVVEGNMSDPLFGVEELSKELAMSRTNMHRKIKAITGFPPSDLIRNIRLRKAAMLLVNKADTVSQISLTVGFEDHSYFTKAFKKHFGVTPSDYLQSREHLN